MTKDSVAYFLTHSVHIDFLRKHYPEFLLVINVRGFKFLKHQPFRIFRQHACFLSKHVYAGAISLKDKLAKS